MTLAHQSMGGTGASSQRSPVLQETAALLAHWLAGKLPAPVLGWLFDRAAAIQEGAPSQVFFTSFSVVPKKTGKADLALSAAERTAALDTRRGWMPGDWSTDQAARAYLLLALPTHDLASYQRALDLLFSAADLRERIALCQCLPLLPCPTCHQERAAESVRSCIDAVFNAVALNNPYPAEQFDDSRWNQMVLKAFFLGSPVEAIQRLEERANPALSRMLVDYAHERRAAGRPVSPDLWRLAALHADDTAMADLEAMLQGNDAKNQTIAALALSSCPHARASTLLASQPALMARLAHEPINWELLREN